MKIVIDGDACPAKEIIREIAINFGVEVHIFVDSSHFFTDDFFQIHVVSKGKDAVDMALYNFMEKGDLVITQDYGLATMALTRSDAVINPLGFLYSSKNIDELLFKRHIGQKARRSGHKGSKIKKRTPENDQSLARLITSLLS
ncbi:MAG: DUF188 domain-containing protein [Vallitaleaceae bacterium]|nr:DUF188 domain-containing protein [Vallitaleaceae bacterium]